METYSKKMIFGIDFLKSYIYLNNIDKLILVSSIFYKNNCELLKFKIIRVIKYYQEEIVCSKQVV